jgi:hypothetical protein
MTDDKEKDKKIKDEIKKAGDSVEPKDKDALAKIRDKTGGSQAGNGKKS